MSQPYNDWSPNPADWSPQKQRDAAGWEQGKSPLPTGLPILSVTSRQRRPFWPWITLGCALAVIAGIIVGVLALTGGGNGGQPIGESGSPAVSAGAPAPISRSDLMADYAKIAPFDRSATPETIDDLAKSTCGLLDAGKSTDLLISTATKQYNANATAVIHLLVSYRCPKYLKDFR